MFQSIACLADGVADIKFIPNLGQWEGDFAAKTPMKAGDIFYLPNKLIWSNLDIDHQDAKKMDAGIKNEAIQLLFPLLGTKNKASLIGAGTTDYNYYFGSDSRFWKSTKAFAGLHFSDKSFDMHYYRHGDNLEFDVKVRQSKRLHAFPIEVAGQQHLEHINGNVLITGQLGSMQLLQPYCYQIVAGKRKEVKSAYKLTDSGFEIVIGRYDTSKELVIDPQIVFSTLSGSVADNWGSTATFDESGNSYGAGMVFSSGFPTTFGVVQRDYAFQSRGSICDIGILKYSPNGRQLKYATYLGGGDMEAPHSLVCDKQGNLYVMGSTGSANFPRTANAPQRIFLGGPSFNPYNFTSLEFFRGSDIFLSKLDSNGRNLLVSTFLGGSGNDGVLPFGSNLVYNYGDQFRGEININLAGDVFLVSSTFSQTRGASLSDGRYQPSSGGGVDGIIVKMNPDLQPIWYSYLGGAGEDALYSIRFNSRGEILLAGGTTSGNFPTTAAAYQPRAVNPSTNFGKGTVNGFAAILSTDGRRLIASTFISTSAYDQTYFVEEDAFDNIYVYGQTEGTWVVTPRAYGNTRNGIYITKFSPDLSQILLSSMVGTGRNTPNISPTAFLVDTCGRVYMAGWGSVLRGTSQAARLSTDGLPTTPGAFQQSTDGNDFYFLLLQPNFESLSFATYFGADGGGGEHVDGGTSRFDKRGVVYQAICAGCGGSQAFPTTRFAYSNFNGSNNCNLGLVKFDFGI